jgi:hypothetical protein
VICFTSKLIHLNQRKSFAFSYHGRQMAQCMSDDALKSDVLQLYRTYDPPPKDFDPRTASDEQLRRHGIPRRPNPEPEPKLARLWSRAFARKPKFIKAELAINPTDEPPQSPERAGVRVWSQQLGRRSCRRAIA